MKYFGFILFFSVSCFSTAKDTILFYSASGDIFDEVRNSISDDLHEDFTFHTIYNDRVGGAKGLSLQLTKIDPDLVVLLGNHPMKVYSEFQRTTKQESVIPSVALVAVNIDQIIKEIKNSTGIVYEVPAVTAGIHLRSLLKTPMVKIGVIYRTWMREYVELNAYYCKRAGIDLIGVEIPDKANSKDVKIALRNLDSENVDALWVVNDSGLLTRTILKKAWVHQLKRLKVPVIVGNSALIGLNFPMGVFSVFPDHKALGLQASNLIIDIRDNGWRADGSSVEQPLSVKKILNLDLTEEWGIPIDRDALGEVDELLF